MTLIAEVFQKISSPKNIYRSLSKKSRFNGYFGKQLSKRTQTLLKFGWQPLYDIYLLLCSQVSYKKFLLVICKISRIFTNTLSADGKYSILKRDNLTQPIQIQVSRKQKTFSEFFSAFLKSNWSFEHFQKKKKMSLIVDVFPKLRTRKNWFHQCRKSPVSRDPSESNLVNAPKDCWNFHGSSFNIFIDRCEGNCLTKSLC